MTRRRSRSALKAKFNKAFSALFEVPKLSLSLSLSLVCSQHRQHATAATTKNAEKYIES